MCPPDHIELPYNAKQIEYNSKINVGLIKKLKKTQTKLKNLKLKPNKFYTN